MKTETNHSKNYRAPHIINNMWLFKVSYRTLYCLFSRTNLSKDKSLGVSNAKAFGKSMVCFFMLKSGTFRNQMIRHLSICTNGTNTTVVPRIRQRSMRPPARKIWTCSITTDSYMTWSLPYVKRFGSEDDDLKVKLWPTTNIKGLKYQSFILPNKSSDR